MFFCYIIFEKNSKTTLFCFLYDTYKLSNGHHKALQAKEQGALTWQTRSWHRVGSSSDPSQQS